MTITHESIRAARGDDFDAACQDYAADRFATLSDRNHAMLTEIAMNRLSLRAALAVASPAPAEPNSGFPAPVIQGEVPRTLAAAWERISGLETALTLARKSLDFRQKRIAELSAAPAGQQPVAWRHSLTHSLHDSEEEVQLSDADSCAQPLYLASPVGLTDKQRVYLDQAQQELEDRSNEQDERGNNSIARGCEASAYVIRELLAAAPDVAAIGEGAEAHPDVARLDAVDAHSWLLEPDSTNDGCWTVYEPGKGWIVTGKLSIRDAIDAALAKHAAPAAEGGAT